MEASSLITEKDPKLYFIQSPPGTGKSTTIVGILSAIFARIASLSSQKEISSLDNIKLLICSPSNSGCDELTRKIISAKNSSNSYLNSIFLVRVGGSKIMPSDLDKFSLEYIANKRYKELVRKSITEDMDSLEKELTLVNEKLNDLEVDKKEKYKKDFPTKKKELIKIKEELLQIIGLVKYNGNVPLTVKISVEKSIKEMILREADVIISTLNYCGNPIMDCLAVDKNNGNNLVNLLIVDEAAHCVEVQSLIPLRFGCNKIIQVGDPEQLPSTIFSKSAHVIYFSRYIIDFFNEKKLKMHPFLIFP